MNVNILKLASVIGTCVVHGIAMEAIPTTVIHIPVGEHVLFPVTFHDNVQYEVTIRRRSPLSIKILGWRPSSSEKPYIVHPLYQRRIEIYLKRYVMLKNLLIADSGEYEIQTNYFEAVLKNRDQSIFNLQVYEPVSQPVVTIHGNCGTADNITLRCSVSNGSNVMFHWEKDYLSINDTYATELVIDCINAKEHDTYKCIAKNPISNASSNPVSSGCFDGNDSTDNSRHRIVLVLVSLLIAILAITTFGYFLHESKSSKCYCQK
uniref:Allergin-1-like n=1 Tax=Callorhinchus milii TaxID=7868 RepID=A0A4W3J5U7_CALMI